MQPLALAYFRLIVLHRLFTLYRLQILRQNPGQILPLSEEDTNNDVLLWFLLWGARYTGQEYDPETGFYYYGARYYDPRVSTWVSADPALAEYLPTAKQNLASSPFSLQNGGARIYNSVSLSSYQYARWNPLKYIDLDGRVDVANNSSLPIFYFPENGDKHNNKKVQVMQPGKHGDVDSIIMIDEAGNSNIGSIQTDETSQKTSGDELHFKLKDTLGEGASIENEINAEGKPTGKAQIKLTAVQIVKQAVSNLLSSGKRGGKAYTDQNRPEGFPSKKEVMQDIKKLKTNTAD